MRARVVAILVLTVLAEYSACSSGSSGPSDSPTPGSNVAQDAGGACVGWRQTSSCIATGPREPQNDKGCDVPIASGWSGYCECNATTVGVGCGHPVAACDQVCASGQWPGVEPTDAAVPDAAPAGNACDACLSACRGLPSCCQGIGCICENDCQSTTPCCQTYCDPYGDCWCVQACSDAGVPDAGPTKAGIGDPCSANGDCAAGTCIADGTGYVGWCTKSCATSDDCGANTRGLTNECAITRSGNLCFPGCGSASDCSVFTLPDLQCAAFGNASICSQ